MTYRLPEQSSGLSSSQHKIRQAVCHALVVLALGSTFAPLTYAQENIAAERQQQYTIAAGSLEDALAEFAQQAGILISFEPELVSGKQSSGLQGNYTAKQAVSKLLQGTGLDQVVRENGTWGLRKLPSTQLQQGGSLPEVKVKAGRQSESVEDLPQVYSGGQVASGARAGILGNRDFMDTPFTITSYTRELIQNQQATTVADIIANDPSVRSTNARGGRFDQFTVRGFNLPSSNLALNGLYGVVPSYAVAAESIERVEVLKGASTLLNGMAPTGAVGGAINIVPKRATDKNINQLTTSFASKEQVGAHLDLGRRFGPDNSVGIRVNGAYRTPGETAFDHQSTEQTVGTVAIDYKGAQLKLSLDAGYQQRNIDAPPERVSLDTSIVPDAKRIDRNFAPRWTYTNTKDTYAALRAEYDFTPHFNGYAAIGGRKGENAFLRSNPDIDALGNFATDPSLFYRDERVFSAEAGLRSKFSTGPLAHTVTLGMSKYRQVFGNRIYNLSGSSNSNIYSPTRTTRPNTQGFSQHTPKSGLSDLESIALTDAISILDDRLLVVIGARSQRVQVDTFNASEIRSQHYNQQALTPAAAVVFKLQDNVSVYANYMESLSPGGTAPTNATVNNPGEVLPPIKSKQVETGVKIDNGRFANTFSLFRIEQPNAFTENRIFGLNGEQRNVGLEWNIFGEPVKGLRTLGGIMLLDSKLTKTVNGTNDGARSPATSRANVNLGMEWDTPFYEGLTLTARTLYSSSQYLDNANTQKVPNWIRFDIGARYVTSANGHPITLRANVENLFDRSYWASASGGLTISTPRTLLLSATVDF